MTKQAILLVALGCPKNRVDSERMAGLARRHGLELVSDPACAETILVNTCGFLADAAEESIDTVLELAQYKEQGRCRRLIMAGCLTQRHPEDLAREMPEVDHFIGTSDLARLDRILGGEETPRQWVGPPQASGEERFERDLSGSSHTAYLKIAEGCDRPCAFCIIPDLRGPQRSFTVAALEAETRQLAGAGVRELVLVAQDTTAYGRDLAPRVDLAELLATLDSVDGLRWIRLLYAYPSAMDERLCAALGELPRVVPYVDLPIQHVDDEVLRRMKRGYTADRVRRCLDDLRQAVPGVALRTTLICGHPGETQEAHQAMMRFITEQRLDHLGVFTFSPEEGTDSATQPAPVPAELAAERTAELMELQRGVSRRLLAARVGQQLDVLVDGPSPESELLMEGRHAGQAPEVDGVVVLADGGGPVGEIIRVEVIDAGDYDLVARPVDRSNPG